MSYNPTNPNGQATMANSQPVVVASDQSAVPVSVSSLPLPTGAAQDGTDGSGITPPSGAVGIRGWLSGIYSKLLSALSVTFTNTTIAVTQSVAANLKVDLSGTGTNDTPLNVNAGIPASAALADAVANPSVPTVGAVGLIYNGSTVDRARDIKSQSGTADNDAPAGIAAAGVGPGFSIRKTPSNLTTVVNDTSVIDVNGVPVITLSLNTTTTGTFIIEGTVDGTNWIGVNVYDLLIDTWVDHNWTITPTAGKIYHILCDGFSQIRLKVTATLGATVAHRFIKHIANSFIHGIDTGNAPHSIGFAPRNFAVEYTTAQTGTAIWTPASGRKFVVTDITVTTGGTTAGVVTLWQGASADTAYTAGTDPCVFKGEFAPSTTSKPGVVKTFKMPFVSTTADHILRITTSAAMTVYVQVTGYEI